MKVFVLNDQNNNVGDTLNKPILEHFGFTVEAVPRNYNGKFVGVGSIMTAVRSKDIVWGAGCIRDKQLEKPGARFLAVRGKLSRDLVITDSEIPEVYGDPALLMPLIYNPTVDIEHDIGIVPHYIDKQIAPVGDGHFIDVQQDWRRVIREIKSCRRIIASSLHGLVLAEAYGIPATWVSYSDNIIGGKFKYHDYLTGTGRAIQDYGDLPPIKDLAAIQQGLIKALEGVEQWHKN